VEEIDVEQFVYKHLCSLAIQLLILYNSLVGFIKKIISYDDMSPPCAESKQA
jgi:hypothetical protein